MNDSQFLQALESCTLPPAEFSHRQHLRAAFLYLSALPFGAAIDAMCGTLKAYVAHLGCPDRYHETITVAFMALVNQHRGDDGETWDQFIERVPELQDSKLLQRYYGSETLSGSAARRRFTLERREIGY